MFDTEADCACTAMETEMDFTPMKMDERVIEHINRWVIHPLNK